MMALNTLNGYTFGEDEKGSIDTYHKQMKAMKLVLTEGKQYITEKQHMTYSVDDLLAEAYTKQRRMLRRSIDAKAGQSTKGRNGLFGDC